MLFLCSPLNGQVFDSFGVKYSDKGGDDNFRQAAILGLQPIIKLALSPCRTPRSHNDDNTTSPIESKSLSNVGRPRTCRRTDGPGRWWQATRSGFSPAESHEVERLEGWTPLALLNSSRPGTPNHGETNDKTPL